MKGKSCSISHFENLKSKFSILLKSINNMVVYRSKG